MGTGEGAGHAPQYRRRVEVGAVAWRAQTRTFCRLSCHADGLLHARLRQPFASTQRAQTLQENLLLPRNHDQFEGSAFCRRRIEFPQLHLCAVRPRNHESARSRRLAGVRLQGFRSTLLGVFVRARQLCRGKQHRRTGCPHGKSDRLGNSARNDPCLQRIRR